MVIASQGMHHEAASLARLPGLRRRKPDQKVVSCAQGHTCRRDMISPSLGAGSPLNFAIDAAY